MAPNERLVVAIERVRPLCKAAADIHVALRAEDEWSDLTVAQVRRAVTAANARAPPPELSQVERRKHAERERDKKRDRSDRKRPNDDSDRRVQQRQQHRDDARAERIAADKSQLPRQWSKNWFHGLYWEDPAERTDYSSRGCGCIVCHDRFFRKEMAGPAVIANLPTSCLACDAALDFDGPQFDGYGCARLCAPCWFANSAYYERARWARLLATSWIEHGSAPSEADVEKAMVVGSPEFDIDVMRAPIFRVEWSRGGQLLLPGRGMPRPGASAGPR